MAQRSDPPQTLEELIAVLEVESARMKCSARVAKIVTVSVIGFYLALIFAVWAFKKHFPSDMMSTFGTFGSLGGAGAAASARHRRALKLATEFDDPRLIPFLVEATTLQQQSVAKVAREALAVRLPLLDASSAPDSATRKRMANYILTGGDLAYIRAILSCLESFGAAESVPALEAFLDRPVVRNRAAFDKLKAKAQVALADARLRGAKELIQAKEQETSDLLAQSLPPTPVQSESARQKA